MKIRKIPMRMCSLTKERLPKKELIRIVKEPNGNIKIDLQGKMNGRGAYLKKDIKVINKAKKTKSLEKELSAPIDDDIYNELINIIEND